MTEQEIYTEKMHFLIEEISCSIKELEAITAQRDSVTQSIFYDEMRKLKEQSVLVREKFSELRLAGTNSWSKLVSDFDIKYQALIRSYHYFKTQI